MGEHPHKPKNPKVTMMDTSRNKSPQSSEDFEWWDSAKNPLEANNITSADTNIAARTLKATIACNL